MSTLIEFKWLALGTGDKELNARKLPAYFDSPSFYTPISIGVEPTTQVSAHLKGIDTALGNRLLLSGGSLTGALDINGTGASGSSLRCIGSIKVGANTNDAAVAGGGTLRWNGSSYQYSDGEQWKNIASVQPVQIDVVDADVTNPAGQTVFSAGQDLSGLSVQVFENGFLRRPEVDYTITGSDVIFSYSISQGTWISIQISNSSTLSSDIDVSNALGETVFDLGIDLAMKCVQVYENGFLRRVGAAKDYTISGSQVIFNYTVNKGAWVRILVF